MIVYAHVFVGTLMCFLDVSDLEQALMFNVIPDVGKARLFFDQSLWSMDAANIGVVRLSQACLRESESQLKPGEDQSKSKAWSDIAFSSCIVSLCRLCKLFECHVCSLLYQEIV